MTRRFHRPLTPRSGLRPLDPESREELGYFALASAHDRAPTWCTKASPHYMAVVLGCAVPTTVAATTNDPARTKAWDFMRKR